MIKYVKIRNNIIYSLVPCAGETRLAEEKRALDIGCAHGILTRLLSERGYNSFGIDIDRDRVETARKNFGNTRLHFDVQDARSLEFPYQSFDLVLCLEVIEHLRDPEELLTEIRRVLRPEGLLIISTPNMCSLEGLIGKVLAMISGRRTWKAWDETHEQVFSAKEFLELLKRSGFEPSKTVGYYYFPYIHRLDAVPFAKKVQGAFDFARYAHFTWPFLNRVGFSIICMCILQDKESHD